jgi:hypothetical protein
MSVTILDVEDILNELVPDGDEAKKNAYLLIASVTSAFKNGTVHTCKGCILKSPIEIVTALTNGNEIQLDERNIKVITSVAEELLAIKRKV